MIVWPGIGAALVGRVRLLVWWTRDMYLIADVRCLSSVGMVMAHHNGSVLDNLDTRQVRDTIVGLMRARRRRRRACIAPALDTRLGLAGRSLPSKREALHRCCFDAGPESQKVGRHWASIGSTSRIWWFTCYFHVYNITAVAQPFRVVYIPAYFMTSVPCHSLFAGLELGQNWQLWPSSGPVEDERSGTFAQDWVSVVSSYPDDTTLSDNNYSIYLFNMTLCFRWTWLS